MKNAPSLVAILALVACGSNANVSAPAAATHNCDASPAGRYQFVCKDINSSLTDHASDFLVTLSNGTLTVKNITPGAAAGGFASDVAKFAPYQRQSTLDRSACRYQSTGGATRYTYKLAAALFATGKGELNVYDDGGERMASAFFNCQAKR